MLGTVAGLATLPLLAGCHDDEQARLSGNPTATGAATSLTIGLSYLPDIQFAPVYVAQEHGHFARAGLDVTVRHHGAREPLFGALQAGTEDVLYAGAAEMMQARSQGVDVVDFGTIYQKYPVVAIARAQAGLTGAHRLRGKTIGVPGQLGETWFGLLALLRQGGLDQSAVDIQTIGFTQQAALISDKVDVVMGYANNELVRLQDAGIDVASVPVQGNLVGAGLNAMGPTLREREDDLAAVITALRTATAEIADDPAAAVTLSKRSVPTLTTPEQEKAALATLTATLRLIGDPQDLGAQDRQKW
ncbi:MAG: taurine ABC transporter substrate-binding protein, partial [Micrococcales bacterium]